MFEFNSYLKIKGLDIDIRIMYRYKGIDIDTCFPYKDIDIRIMKRIWEGYKDSVKH